MDGDIGTEAERGRVRAAVIGAPTPCARGRRRGAAAAGSGACGRAPRLRGPVPLREDGAMPEESTLSADEVVDVVDEHDRVVGRATRAEAYARRLRHRCAFVLVRDGEDRIFVHRRTADKLVFPSRYDMFVGGTVGAGESYDEAAHREAEEELGVDGLPAPEPLFTFLFETPRYAWFSAVYQVRCQVPVRPQASEVAWYAFLTTDELAERIDEWDWTPDGLTAYRLLVGRGGLRVPG